MGRAAPWIRFDGDPVYRESRHLDQVQKIGWKLELQEGNEKRLASLQIIKDREQGTGNRE
jgi:hypothetical protein